MDKFPKDHSSDNVRLIGEKNGVESRKDLFIPVVDGVIEFDAIAQKRFAISGAGIIRNPDEVTWHSVEIPTEDNEEVRSRWIIFYGLTQDDSGGEQGYAIIGGSPLRYSKPDNGRNVLIGLAPSSAPIVGAKLSEHPVQPYDSNTGEEIDPDLDIAIDAARDALRLDEVGQTDKARQLWTSSALTWMSLGVVRRAADAWRRCDKELFRSYFSEEGATQTAEALMRAAFASDPMLSYDANTGETTKSKMHLVYDNERKVWLASGRNNDYDERSSVGPSGAAGVVWLRDLELLGSVSSPAINFTLPAGINIAFDYGTGRIEQVIIPPYELMTDQQKAILSAISPIQLEMLKSPEQANHDGQDGAREIEIFPVKEFTDLFRIACLTAHERDFERFPSFSLHSGCGYDENAEAYNYIESIITFGKVWDRGIVQESAISNRLEAAIWLLNDMNNVMDRDVLEYFTTDSLEELVGRWQKDLSELRERSHSEEVEQLIDTLIHRLTDQ